MPVLPDPNRPLASYRKAGPPGSNTYDAEAMAVDLVLICKLGGFTREEFFAGLTDMWDNMIVQVDFTTRGEA